MDNNSKLRFILSCENVWSNEDNSIETVVDVIEQKMREAKIRYRITSMSSINGGEYVSTDREMLIEALDNMKSNNEFANVLKAHINL